MCNTRTVISVMGLTAAFLSSFASAADWPQWRGPSRDGKSTDVGLLKEWSATGPKLAWRTAGLGKGYGSVSLQGNRLYVVGDERDDSVLRCFSADGGKTLWSAKVGKSGMCGPSGWDFAGPRSTPTVDGELVFAVNQWGEFTCVGAADG